MDATPLAYAILALLGVGPKSGYDLRVVFATTPLAVFSESPGSIYPALRRLRQAGWIEPVVTERGGRRRTLFAPTAAGRDALRNWLAGPVLADDVRRRPEVLDLRFALMDLVEPPLDATSFLAELRAHLETWRAELAAVLQQQGPSMTANGRAGLRLGLEIVQVRAAWADALWIERTASS